MSTITTVVTTCDINGCDKVAAHEDEVITMIFTTDQTEGRSTDPYISDATMDMCDEHYQKYINTFPLTAHGAQGNNKYTFRDEE